MRQLGFGLNAWVCRSVKFYCICFITQVRQRDFSLHPKSSVTKPLYLNSGCRPKLAMSVGAIQRLPWRTVCEEGGFGGRVGTALPYQEFQETLCLRDMQCLPERHNPSVCHWYHLVRRHCMCSPDPEGIHFPTPFVERQGVYPRPLQEAVIVLRVQRL